MGKAALASAPSLPLPEEILRRAKTGFGVPTTAWTRKVSMPPERGPRMTADSKGLAYRRWSQFVLGHAGVGQAPTAPA
jgi:asparagine synthase (glutamine-hydrolysing)